MFGGNRLDIFGDSQLDLFIAVRVEWFLGPFGRLEGGFLGAVLLFLCDSAGSTCLVDLALRNKLQGVGQRNRVNKLSVVALYSC